MWVCTAPGTMLVALFLIQFGTWGFAHIKPEDQANPSLKESIFYLSMDAVKKSSKSQPEVLGAGKIRFDPSRTIY